MKEALVHDGVLIFPPSADVGWTTPFEVKNEGVYAIFALEQSLLFPKTPPLNLALDGRYFSPQTTGGAWSEYGSIELAAGGHSLTDGYPDPNLVVALVNVDALKAWEDRIAELTRALPQNLVASKQVYAAKTTITVPRAGHYRIRATAVGPFGPDGLLRTRATGKLTRGLFPASFSSTLPFIYGNGVVGTAPVMMPERWYREDAAAYQWGRGDPVSWLLFANDSHVHVFVTGKENVRARADIRVSRLQVSDTLSARVDGRTQTSVVLAGPPAGAQALDTVAQLDGPTPVPVSLSLLLRPGWNDVAFGFRSLNGERIDLGPGIISAAVAPDLSFTRVANAGRDPAPVQSDRTFSALALSKPPGGLAGDPDLEGTVSGIGSGSVWLAAAIAGPSGVEYRLFPIANDGAFDINFLHAFPNGWNDQSRRMVGLWFIARRARPAFSDLYYNVHAMPGRALRHPLALSNLRLRVDGRAVGAAPVLLAAGRHRVQSGDPEVQIGLLTVAPVRAPQTKSFALNWRRRSPTALDVTAGRSANPFLLVFGEAFSPEWQATLDGTPLKHVIVNGVSNGWIVPALPEGSSQINLTFVGQRYYVIAATVSLVSLAIFALLACIPRLWPIRTTNS